MPASVPLPTVLVVITLAHARASSGHKLQLPDRGRARVSAGLSPLAMRVRCFSESQLCRRTPRLFAKRETSTRACIVFFLPYSDRGATSTFQSHDERTTVAVRAPLRSPALATVAESNFKPSATPLTSQSSLSLFPSIGVGLARRGHRGMGATLALTDSSSPAPSRPPMAGRHT